MEKDAVYLRNQVYEMKKDALKMALDAGRNGSHLGGGFSCMEILAVLHLKVMDLSRDRFFIGKAHGVLAYYTALKQAGYVSAEDLASFETNGSAFSGHPVRDLTKKIYYSGGSLGMALSVAVGSAYHLRRTVPAAKVYVLLGDGECQEGSIWEAAMTAAHFRLSNLICIIDKNRLQYDASTADLLGVDDFCQRFAAFGWNTVKVNGHDPADLTKALVQTNENQPLLVEALTKKGNGISFMQDNLDYHHHELSLKNYEIAMAELAKEYEQYAGNI